MSSNEIFKVTMIQRGTSYATYFYYIIPDNKRVLLYYITMHANINVTQQDVIVFILHTSIFVQ